MDVIIHSNAEIKQICNHGNHIGIDYGFYCTANMTLGNYVHIGPHCSVIGGKDSFFTMEDFTFLAAGCRIICASDEHNGYGIGIPFVPEFARDKIVNKPVVIKKFAGVCTNAVIFPGVTIGEGAIVGAGCVVRRNLEPWQIYIPGPGLAPIPTFLRPKDKIIEKANEISS